MHCFDLTEYWPIYMWAPATAMFNKAWDALAFWHFRDARGRRGKGPYLSGHKRLPKAASLDQACCAAQHHWWIGVYYQVEVRAWPLSPGTTWHEYVSKQADHRLLLSGGKAPGNTTRSWRVIGKPTAKIASNVFSSIMLSAFNRIKQGVMRASDPPGPSCSNRPGWL